MFLIDLLLRGEYDIIYSEEIFGQENCPRLEVIL